MVIFDRDIRIQLSMNFLQFLQPRSTAIRHNNSGRPIGSVLFLHQVPRNRNGRTARTNYKGFSSGPLPMVPGQKGFQCQSTGDGIFGVPHQPAFTLGDRTDLPHQPRIFINSSKRYGKP